MEKPNVLNGVNVEDLGKTVNAIKENPSLAKCKFRAKNKWLDGGHNCATVKGFFAAGREDSGRVKPFELQADEPPVLLGQDRGANPVEYLLSALSSCMTTSMVYHASANNQKIQALESEFEGDIDLQGFLGLSKSIRPGYQNIRAIFRVKSDATLEQLDSWVRLSPVFDVVSRSVPVSLEIVKV